MNIALIDGSFLAHTARHGYDGLGVHKPNGKFQHTGIVYGFWRMLLEITSKEFQYDMNLDSFDEIAICWDLPPTHRISIDNTYKQDRRGGRDLDERRKYNKQLQHIKASLFLTGVPQFNSPGFECDDVIFTVAIDLESDGHNVVMFANDHDMFQALTANIRMCNMHRLFTTKWFKQKYEIDPRQWTDVKTLVGCKGDGVAGVPGIGEKTALKLIRQHHSWSRILESENQSSSYKKIREFGEEALEKVESLVRLYYIGANDEEDESCDGEMVVKVGKPNMKALMALFDMWKMYSLMKFPMLLHLFMQRQKEILSIYKPA